MFRVNVSGHGRGTLPQAAANSVFHRGNSEQTFCSHKTKVTNQRICQMRCWERQISRLHKAEKSTRCCPET